MYTIVFFMVHFKQLTTKISGPPETALIGGQRHFLLRPLGLAGPLHFAGWGYHLLGNTGGVTPRALKRAA